MALTKTGTDGIKDSAVTTAKIGVGQVTSASIAPDTIVDGDIADATISLAKLEHGTSSNNGKFLRANNGADPTWETVSTTPEGTTILSTGESGGTKFLREDGDGSCSWQTVNTTPEGTAVLSTGESGGTKFLREDGDGSCSWQSIPASDVVSDTSPQLGGDLDTNSNSIKFGDSNGSSTNLAAFGASEDLRIYHNGSETYIQNAGSDLLLYAGGNSIKLQAENGEEGVKVIADGAVELYHNGTKQCETSANGLAFPSGKGIDFSATADGSSVSNESELLDDYEKGEWTGSINTGTANINDEWYVKIGNLVMGGAGITAISDTSSNSAIKVNGLPFSANSTGYGAVGGSKNTAFSQMCVTQVSGSSVYLMKSSTSTGSWNYILHSDQVQSTGGIVFSFQYFVS